MKEVSRFDDRAKKTDKDDALVEQLNDFSNRQAKRMMREWTKLDHYLLVKYIDGNIKKEKDGKFERNEAGTPVQPNYGGYTQDYYNMVGRGTGDRIKIKEIESMINNY